MSDKRDREKRREERLQEESDANRQAQRKRLTQLVSGAVFLVVVIVAVVIVVAGNQGGGSTNLTDVTLVKEMLSGVPQEGTVLGDPKAKVKLIEFGDLQCPVCKSYSEQVIPKLITGPVKRGETKIEFRNFTIIGPESKPAGAAALAAGEQERGWSYIELFYRNQGTERSGYVTDAFMESVAKGAGVKNLAKWNADRKSKSLLAEVTRTTGQAESLGFNGTPSFAIEGPGVKGLEPLGTPESTSALEAEIKKAGE